LKPDIREALGAFVIRLANRAGKTIDLGIPKTVHHGRYSMLLTGGHARRLTPHVWVSIESADGKVVQFQRAMGALDRVPTHWPEATAPVRASMVYSSLGFDPVAFYAAVEPEPAAGSSNR